MWSDVVGKKGKVIVGILIVMILVVLTSAVILSLVKFGVIEVRDVTTEPLLNAEFVPLERKGGLVVKDFQFCGFVDDDFECFNDRKEFDRLENVYVRFVVESSTSNGEVMLVRNYRIKNPSGEVVLELDQKNSYNFEIKGEEPVIFADYFIMGEDAVLGEYVLDVVVENPLLDKRITLSKKFTLVSSDEG